MTISVTSKISGLKPNRRNFLKSASAIAAASIIPSSVLAQGASKHTMKVAISLPESHPTTAALRAISADIQKESNGRLTLDVYPNGQLGSDGDTLSQVRAGAIDFICTANSIYGNIVPVCLINNLAFAFPDYATVWKAMDGDLGAHINSQLEKANLVPVGKVFDHGFRQITNSSKPITSPKDLAGMKLRVPVTPVYTTLFKALDAAPAGIPLGELYTALQTKVVDGQENPLSLIESAKFYEVQKFCSLTSHVWDCFALVGNKRTWAALPEDLRQMLTRVVDANALKQRAVNEALNRDMEAKLKGFGMQFNPVDTKPFREMVQKSGFYAEWEKKFGPEAWSLLEKFSGKLT